MSGFVDYLPEVFSEFGSITLRKMFGGHGVYYQGLMFGLVIDDTLYLKADATSLPWFEREGLPPFVYSDRHGRHTTLSYRQAPDEIFDDQELAALWARRAFEAALRAQAAKTARPTKATTRAAPETAKARKTKKPAAPRRKQAPAKPRRK